MGETPVKDPYDVLKLENQLCFPLYACAKEVIRRYREPLEELNLTYTQYIVMMTFWEFGSMTEGELGQKVRLDSGTLAPLLKRLEARGLISRERLCTNERKLLISLTEKGEILKEEAVHVPEAMRDCLDLQEEELRTAARAACLDDTIQSFTKGYDTAVGERGVTLSGGQKQRAAIARMLTRPTPVMIFDDSLSAVDTETDAKIRAELEKRFGSATIILISHRITTLAKADQVLVLDHGRVAQLGTPEELSKQDGLYKQIENIQSMNSQEEVNA